MLRHVARAMLGAVFIQTGIDQIRHPQTRAVAAGPYIHSLAERTRLPDDPDLIIRVNGSVLVAGGVALVTNTAPRLSAVVLAAGLIPATAFGHQFWTTKDPEQRGRDSVQFLKNLGLLGGLILAAIDTQGQPGLRWRAQDGGHRAARAAKRAGRTARREAKVARLQARTARRDLAATVRAERIAATASVERNARRAVRRAGRVVAAAGENLPRSGG